MEDRGGLLVLWWVPGSRLTPADVLGSYEAIRDLSDGYLVPLVAHLQGLVGITAHARSLLLEGSLTSRVALVGTGPVDQVITGFLEQALTESRYFTSVSDAVAWARCSRPS
jgi:hypothetical protein